MEGASARVSACDRRMQLLDALRKSKGSPPRRVTELLLLYDSFEEWSVCVRCVRWPGNRQERLVTRQCKYYDQCSCLWCWNAVQNLYED